MKGHLRLSDVGKKFPSYKMTPQTLINERKRSAILKAAKQAHHEANDDIQKFTIKTIKTHKEQIRLQITPFRVSWVCRSVFRYIDCRACLTATKQMRAVRAIRQQAS